MKLPKETFRNLHQENKQKKDEQVDLHHHQPAYQDVEHLQHLDELLCSIKTPTISHYIKTQNNFN